MSELDSLLELVAAEGFTPEEFLQKVKSHLELVSIMERKTNSEITLEGEDGSRVTRKELELTIAALEAHISRRKADG
jgi:hypothetical protein